MQEEEYVVAAEEVVDASGARLEDTIYVDGRVVQAVHEAAQEDAIAQVAHQVTDLAVLQQGRVIRRKEVLPERKRSSELPELSCNCKRRLAKF